MSSIELDKQLIDCYLSNTCTVRQLCLDFHISCTKLYNTLRRHSIQRRPLSVLSTTHRLKIADSLRKAHSDGRHLGWTAVNSKKGDSYPEQCFKQFLTTDPMFSGLTILSKVPVRRYVLDFVLADYKIDIEVDGQFHFYDQKTIAKDKVRDATLTADGWRVFRVSWVLFRDHRELVASELRTFIRSSTSVVVQYNNPNSSATMQTLSNTDIRYCTCGSVMHRGSTNCRKCSDRIRPRPIKLAASREDIINLLATHSLSAIGRLYGVSAKAVEKRCRRDGIDYRSIWSNR